MTLRTLAAAQTMPRRGDVAANLQEHLRIARAAAAEQAQVLLFPELSLTGYELDLADDLAFTDGDPRLDPLRELASARKLTLVVGAPLRLESRLHIGALVLFPDGTTAVYTKHRLGAFPASASCDGVVPPAEAGFFEPGTADPLVRMHGYLTAMAICADIGQPSHAEQAAARGAGTYLASMFVIPSEFDGELSRLRTYAVRHAFAVVFANYGGPSGGLAAAGRSAIWSERGELLAQLDAAGSGLVVAAETKSGWRARALIA